MNAAQPLKVVRDEYSKLDILRELEFVHKRLNGLAISPAQVALKTTYTAGDLGAAADIATAINATNTAINALLSKLNLSQ